MTKKKVTRKSNKPLNLYAFGGDAFSSEKLGGTIGAIGSGISGIVGAGIGNAQIADTSNIEANIKNNQTYQVGASTNDALMNEWSNFSPMEKVSWRDVRGGNGGQRAMSTISGMGSGAAAGATMGGPVGAVIGGVAGLASGIAGIFTGNRKAKKKAKAFNNQIDIANDRNLSALEDKSFNIDTQNDLNAMANFSANGGYINTFENGGNIGINVPNGGQHGGDFSNGVTVIGNGGTHEENPLQGVPMGVDPEGTPNLVEEGEVKYNGYIFSNRLFANEELLEMVNLPKSYSNNSFAAIAEKLSKESEERPNDPISKKGLSAAMSKLQQAQEQIRAMEMLKEQQATMPNQFALGGKPNSRASYTLPLDLTPSNFEVNVNRPVVPNVSMDYVAGKATPRQADFVLSNKKYLNNASVPAKQVPNLQSLTEGAMANAKQNLPAFSHHVGSSRVMNSSGQDFDSTALRYAPVVGAGINSLTDMLGLTNKPDYTNSDLIGNSVKNMPVVDFNPVGNYLGYNPFDRNYHTNKLGAMSESSRRAIINNAGGNRATATAGILASDYNSQAQLGTLARQAEEYNQGLKERVETFNRQTNMYNSEMGLKTDMANLQTREAITRARIAEAQMRDAVDGRSSMARSANLTNFFDSIGDIGREQFAMNMVNSDKSLYYGVDGKGTQVYKNSNKKSKGGYLTKRGGKNGKL